MIQSITEIRKLSKKELVRLKNTLNKQIQKMERKLKGKPSSLHESKRSQMVKVYGDIIREEQRRHLDS